MSSTIRPGEENDGVLARIEKPTGRRDFLRWTGAGAFAVIAGAACDTEDTRTIVEVTPPDTVEVAPPVPTFTPVTISFANDFGVLNFAYALEQLEAAFYTQVVTAPGFTTTFGAEEQRLLLDIKDHEVIHREFFKAALAANAIPALTPNFSAINFGSRLSVLNAARDFEDLGVAAYNGAARFLSNTEAGRNFVVVAGKIVSVEARHASAIRDRLQPRSGAFAPEAFDPALAPSAVLGAAAPFIRNTITLTNVPA